MKCIGLWWNIHCKTGGSSRDKAMSFVTCGIHPLFSISVERIVFVFALVFLSCLMTVFFFSPALGGRMA